MPGRLRGSIGGPLMRFVGLFTLLAATFVACNGEAPQAAAPQPPEQHRRDWQAVVVEVPGCR